MKYFAFLDTNTFLHYEAIDHIDWLTFLQAKDVVLIVSPVVIRELNKHKDNPSAQKTRDRASAALKKLHDWFENEGPVSIRRCVELQYLPRDPVIDLSLLKLSPLISDDHLIATIIEFKEVENAVVLVTEDLGLKIKSRAHGIPVRQLPAELRLTDEVGREQKKINDLENEVRRLRHLAPAVRLLFANNTNRIHLSLRPPEVMSEEAIAARLRKIKTKHPKMGSGKPVTPAEVSAGAIYELALGGVSREEIDSYDSQLDEYYEKYTDFVTRVNRFENSARLTAQLDIDLVNEGTCPAEDVDIFMHFPDGFALYSEETLPTRPSPPKAPAKPMTPSEKFAAMMAMPHFPNIRSALPPILDLAPRNVSSLSIKKTRSYDVQLDVAKVKHGFVQSLEPLYVSFPSVENVCSFSIDYRLHPSNAPDVVEDKLHVVVDLPTP